MTTIGVLSSAVEIRRFTSGAIYLPAEFNTDAMTFQGAEASDGTFAVLLDASAGSVGFTAASGARWYALPASALAVNWLKVVTGTATAAAATALLCLKT